MITYGFDRQNSSIVEVDLAQVPPANRGRVFEHRGNIPPNMFCALIPPRFMIMPETLSGDTFSDASMEGRGGSYNMMIEYRERLCILPATPEAAANYARAVFDIPAPEGVRNVAGQVTFVALSDVERTRITAQNIWIPGIRMEPRRLAPEFAFTQFTLRNWQEEIQTKYVPWFGEQ
jgi:hypothetical protein